MSERCEKKTRIDGKKCKVQFRKPVTVNGVVTYIQEVDKFQVVTEKGTSLIDPNDIILIEELGYGIERHESEVY